jgi:hypothetical protein
VPAPHALWSDFVRCGSFRVRDPGLISSVSIIATAEKDRASKDASLPRMNGCGPGRLSTYASTCRCVGAAKGKHPKLPYSSPDPFRYRTLTYVGLSHQSQSS